MLDVNYLPNHNLSPFDTVRTGEVSDGITVLRFTNDEIMTEAAVIMDTVKTR